MVTFGIICEFNPLHNGHKRLIDEARRLGAECIVCIMSGNAVQRGELAITDKYNRAKAAILVGTDLVLELPFPWSAASAEYFAGAGVDILSGFCDHIIFGSECGDIELLEKAAEAASGKEFKERLKNRLSSGEGAAVAYFSELEAIAGIKLNSNDLLGVEYMKAAKQKGYSIEFHTIKREGSAYNDTELCADQNPSATALRRAWSEGVCAFEYIPKEAAEIFEECIKKGDITDAENISRAVLMYLRLLDPQTLSETAESDGGIANRIISCARSAKSSEEMFELLRTKRYTDAKLRRAMLFLLTNVKAELLKQTPDYTVLLGANDIGRGLLSSARKNGGTKVVTKSADAPKDSEQYKAGERLEAIFTLACKETRDVGDNYRKSAFIK